MRGMRNYKQKTSYDDAREILFRADYGVLSTTCDDGLPYGVPLSYVLSGNAVYFHCATEGQKLDNIMHDSRVCLTAVAAAQRFPDKLTMGYESAMVFGTARIVYAENERQAALRLLCGKYAPDIGEDALAAYFAKYAANTTVLRLDVEYIAGKRSQ